MPANDIVVCTSCTRLLSCHIASTVSHGSTGMSDSRVPHENPARSSNCAMTTASRHTRTHTACVHSTHARGPVHAGSVHPRCWHRLRQHCPTALIGVQWPSWDGPGFIVPLEKSNCNLQRQRIDSSRESNPKPQPQAKRWRNCCSTLRGTLN